MFPAAPPEPAAPTSPPCAASRHWPAWLFWSGAVACLSGLLGHRLFEHWVPARTTALLLIALLAPGLAWGLRRTTGLAIAHGLAMVWLLALAWLGGPVPMLTTLVAAAGAIALGGLLPWLAWRHRSVLDARSVLGGFALIVALGGSSYTYAWAIAGNPVLPLMNDVFGSPYFGGTFSDPRWHEGAGPLLPWRLTFETDRYLEAFPGGGGFVLVALAGAWLLALRQRGTRAIATQALAAGLALAGARLEDAVGDVEWWSLPSAHGVDVPAGPAR